MDVQMPEMDGLEATQAIRELEKDAGRPHADRRGDRARHGRRPRALPGGGHGRLRQQAAARRRAVPGRGRSAAAARDREDAARPPRDRAASCRRIWRPRSRPSGGDAALLERIAPAVPGTVPALVAKIRTAIQAGDGAAAAAAAHMPWPARCRCWPRRGPSEAARRVEQLAAGDDRPPSKPHARRSNRSSQRSCGCWRSSPGRSRLARPGLRTIAVQLQIADSRRNYADGVAVVDVDRRDASRQLNLAICDPQSSIFYAAASFFSSDRSPSIFPAPSTTEVSGSSAICTGSCVSSAMRRSRLRSIEPPPVIMMPRS